MDRLTRPSCVPRGACVLAATEVFLAAECSGRDGGESYGLPREIPRTGTVVLPYA